MRLNHARAMTRQRMVSFGGGLALSVVLGLASAPIALATGPSHEKGGTSIQTFDAGIVCDFAVEWDSRVTTDNVMLFPVQTNGDQLLRVSGRELLIVTNLDTDASVVLRGGYREDLLFHADGSIDVTINGTIVAGYFPTDLGGPSMWWYKGHLQDGLDDTFTLLEHAFVGSTTDLCAALS